MRSVVRSGIGTCLVIVALSVAACSSDVSGPNDSVVASQEFEDHWSELQEGNVPGEALYPIVHDVIQAVADEPNLVTSDGQSGPDILYFIVTEHEKAIVWVSEAQWPGSAGWHMERGGVLAAETFLHLYPEDPRVNEVRQVLKRVQLPGASAESTPNSELAGGIEWDR